MRRKYFPNNWQAIKDCPDKFFLSMSYDQFLDWKIHGYDIPDSVFGILRLEDKKTGKITEKFYSSPHHARRCLDKSLKENKDITLCTMDGIYHLTPSFPIDWNNESNNNKQNVIKTL